MKIDDNFYSGIVYNISFFSTISDFVGERFIWYPYKVAEGKIIEDFVSIFNYEIKITRIEILVEEVWIKKNMKRV